MATDIRHSRGFVALTLVIMVSSLLLAFTFVQSVEIGSFFDMTQRKGYRLMNYYNAQKCIDQAVLNLAHDYFYETSIPTEILDLHCSIDVVKKENDLRLIEVRGNYKNAVVKRAATARLYDNRVELISTD